MVTVHLVHGYLAVGKTTFARRLEQAVDGVRFSLDDTMTTLVGADPALERAAFDEWVRRVLAVLETTWTRVVTLGTDVVLDYGFWTRAARDSVRQRAADLGGDVKLYWVTCSDEIARERCRRRNEDPAGSFVIDDAAFDDLRQRFEPLGTDEPHVVIDTSADAVKDSESGPGIVR